MRKLESTQRTSITARRRRTGQFLLYLQTPRTGTPCTVRVWNTLN